MKKKILIIIGAIVVLGGVVSLICMKCPFTEEEVQQSVSEVKIQTGESGFVDMGLALSNDEENGMKEKFEESLEQQASEMEELKLGDITLYAEPGAWMDGYLDNRSYSDKIILKENGQYILYTGVLFPDLKQGLLFEIKDIYINEYYYHYGNITLYKGPIIWENFLFENMLGRETYIPFTYLQEQKQLKIYDCASEKYEYGQKCNFSTYIADNREKIDTLSFEEFDYDTYGDPPFDDSYEFTLTYGGEKLHIYTDITRQNNFSFTDDGVKYEYFILSEGEYLLKKSGTLLNKHKIGSIDDGYIPNSVNDGYIRSSVRANVDYDTMMVTITIDGDKNFQRSLNELSTLKEI
ncbi:hypothetical protein AGMMS50249_0260 [candidate division SR1 bacterium]|nr:hypothetical protein AGMMS50249_0260 [candidate division SR1 bacterium]